MIYQKIYQILIFQSLNFKFEQFKWFEFSKSLISLFELCFNLNLLNSQFKNSKHIFKHIQ